MSLPNPVLDLAAEVVPEAEDRGRLAFAYAHGSALSGFGSDQDVGIVCVWDHDAVPVGAPTAADHLTITEFHRRVDIVTTGDGWEVTDLEPLATVARFAYGVLLSDDEGAGTSARGAVSDFPQALCEISAKALTDDRDTIAERLTGEPDPWRRAELVIGAANTGYVAWFAASGHYYPGPASRAQYAEYFGLEGEVLRLERVMWEQITGDVGPAYVAFAERILADC